jgi:hypothetical protein
MAGPRVRHQGPVKIWLSNATDRLRQRAHGWKHTVRPLPLLLGAAWGITHAVRAPIDDAAANRGAALCDGLLRKQGITCTAATDVVWLDGSHGVLAAMFGRARALVLARDRAHSEGDVTATPDARSVDLFAVDVRLSPEGRVLDFDDAHNLTRSIGGDVQHPVVRGSLVAYLVDVDGRPQAAHVLDLAGHDARAYDDLTSTERIQVKIADLQATGMSHGVKKTVVSFVPPPQKATLAFRDDGMLEVRGDGDARIAVVDPRAAAVDPPDRARVTPEAMSKPPTFGPWMSDRLRAVSWFGDEKNQALKAIVFTTLEWVKDKRAAITGDTGEEAAQDDLGGKTTTAAPTSFTDPESGWPPRPLEPMMKPPLAGEGQWIRLDDDPFITPIPGMPSPFVTTFVRTDPTAAHTRVYITLWDPRLVALHMVAGTVEPVSATGEAGPGKIPRTPETLRHVIGGFNGGFQATHGEFGMQADGVLYLPPKPYAATVLDMRDGSTAFAAWPKDAAVPEDVRSFRQNMTFMVQNDKYNPWGRAWWGGVPPGWHDAIHTTRSGLCLTKEGYVAYLFGHDIGPEPLGRAMLVARCQVGMHLDMNPGLAGFEFYNVQPAAEWKPIGRPLQSDWEYEGAIKDAPEFKFRARRMTRSMGHILFPRYIGRDSRDFFYLTARDVLPGAPLEAGAEWRVKGLPQHGYPYATAITSVRLAPPSERRVRVLRVDPRTVGTANDSDAPAVLVLGRAAHPRGATHARGEASTHAAAVEPPNASNLKLWLDGHSFRIGTEAPSGASSLATLLDAKEAASTSVRSAVGISDSDGTLTWVELQPEDAPGLAANEAMLSLLARLGCTARALVAGELRAFLGGTLDVGGDPASPMNVTAKLARTPAIGAKQIFESTPIVPQSVWQPLQAQRVKWRPTLAPPDKPAPSASTSGSSSAAPPPPAPGR